MFQGQIDQMDPRALRGQRLNDVTGVPDAGRAMVINARRA